MRPPRASGMPCKMWTGIGIAKAPPREQGAPPVHARSLLIDYRMKEDKLILSRDAQLEQEGSTITGERIEYDLLEEIIRAQGDLEGRQRIHMVIPPARNEGQPAAETEADAGTEPETDDTAPLDTQQEAN